MLIDSFFTRWSASGDAERANKDSFLNELCDVLFEPAVDAQGKPAAVHFTVSLAVRSSVSFPRTDWRSLRR